MPKLLRSSEAVGCGATIELDSKEVVFVSIAQTGVLVRLIDMRSGMLNTLLSNFFGPKLYNEQSVFKNATIAQALRIMFPDQAPSLSFKNAVLSSFSNAIWHCSSAAEVCKVLNEAAAEAPKSDEQVESLVLQRAFEAAKNWPPKRSPEQTAASYSVFFSDGVRQEQELLPIEIEKWASASNKMFKREGKPFRIVRITDTKGEVVWGS